MYSVIKRGIDVFGAVLLLQAFLPLIALVALLVRINLGPGVFFRQVRPGLNEQPFELIKFRTLQNKTDQYGCLLPDDKRLTPFGKALRATSLDELPGLLNVLRGDMSLVGPRPLLMEYLPLYSADQSRRHKVRPGLTGWAQINGRNAIEWEDKFKLDVWYVDNRSFCLDIKILYYTVIKVIRREGITGIGNVTMSRFTGSDSKLPRAGIDK